MSSSAESTTPVKLKSRPIHIFTSDSPLSTLALCPITAVSPGVQIAGHARPETKWAQHRASLSALPGCSPSPVPFLAMGHLSKVDGISPGFNVGNSRIVESSMLYASVVDLAGARVVSELRSDNVRGGRGESLKGSKFCFPKGDQASTAIFALKDDVGEEIAAPVLMLVLGSVNMMLSEPTLLFWNWSLGNIVAYPKDPADQFSPSPLQKDCVLPGGKIVWVDPVKNSNLFMIMGGGDPLDPKTRRRMSLLSIQLTGSASGEWGVSISGTLLEIAMRSDEEHMIPLGAAELIDEDTVQFLATWGWRKDDQANMGYFGVFHAKISSGKLAVVYVIKTATQDSFSRISRFQSQCGVVFSAALPTIGCEGTCRPIPKRNVLP